MASRKKTIDRLGKLRRDFGEYFEVRKVTKYLFTIYLLLYLPVLVFLARRVLRPQILALGPPARIYIVPDNQTLPPDGTFQVLVDADINLIGFVRVEFGFDTSKVNLTGEIQTTDRLKTVVQKTTKDQANLSGNATVVLGLSPEDRGSPPTGAFEVLNFGMTAVTAEENQTSSITIGGGSQVVSTDAEVLELTTSSANLVINPVATPEPTATPTKAPVATLAPTEGPVIPGQTATPTAAPTAAPTAVPTTAPTAAPTAAPTTAPTAAPLAELVGDLNDDGKVNLLDYVLLFENFGRPKTALVNQRIDINDDGGVNILDYVLLFENFGKRR